MDFGAFVTILPGRDGLVHISQISEERVERVGDKLKEGDVVRVKVLEVDRQGRVRLSMRNVDARLNGRRLRGSAMRGALSRTRGRARSGSRTAAGSAQVVADHGARRCRRRNGSPATGSRGS